MACKQNSPDCSRCHECVWQGAVTKHGTPWQSLGSAWQPLAASPSFLVCHPNTTLASLTSWTPVIWEEERTHMMTKTMVLPCLCTWTPTRVTMTNQFHLSFYGKLTLAVGALDLALASSLRARSYSSFSLSSLTAASQISSLFGFAWNARAKMLRAAGTSPWEEAQLASKLHNLPSTRGIDRNIQVTTNMNSPGLT